MTGVIVRHLLAVFVVAVVLVTRDGFAQDRIAAADSVLELLYPQSAGWTRLATLPRPSAGLLDNPTHVANLGNFTRLQAGDDGCSPIREMLSGDDALDGFHAANVFAANDDDLIYLGPRPCSEGQWTIIWQHGRSSSKPMRAIIIDVVLRKMLFGPQPKAVGVAFGCCAEPWTSFCLYDPVPRGSCVWAATALRVPDNARRQRGDITLQRDVVLLPAPGSTVERDDPYQPPRRPAGIKAEQLARR